MPRAQRKPFYLPSNFVVRKAFIHNGENFAIGDSFPPEDSDITDAKLQKMYNAGYLMHEETKEDVDYSDAVSLQGAKERKLTRAEKRKLAKEKRNGG